MAQPAMTPEEALQTIAGVREYREHLTSRAAGLVWMVWGIALTLLAFQALFADFEGALQGNSQRAAGSDWLQTVGILLCILFAAMLTNIIWKAHALETHRQYPAWIPYVAGLGVVFFLSAIIGISNTIATDGGVQPGPRGLFFAPLALVASGGAAAIAFLQRRRVPMLPGLLASLLLLNIFIVARFIAFDQARDVQFWGSAVLAWAPLITFTLVGLWTMRKA